MSKLSIDNKTVEQFASEIKDKIAYFMCKYHNSLNNKSETSKVDFYRKCYIQYYEIYEMLRHVVKYGSVIDNFKCQDCRLSMGHVTFLKKTFAKYGKLVSSCRDGYRYLS